MGKVPLFFSGKRSSGVYPGSVLCVKKCNMNYCVNEAPVSPFSFYAEPCIPQQDSAWRYPLCGSLFYVQDAIVTQDSASQGERRFKENVFSLGVSHPI